MVVQIQVSTTKQRSTKIHSQVSTNKAAPNSKSSRYPQTNKEAPVHSFIHSFMPLNVLEALPNSLLPHIGECKQRKCYHSMFWSKNFPSMFHKL
jgi:hypothetical protein